MNDEDIDKIARRVLELQEEKGVKRTQWYFIDRRNINARER